MSREEEALRRSPERSTSFTPSAALNVNSTITVAVRKRIRIPGREEDENDVVRCDDGGGSTVTVYEPRTKLDLTPFIEPSSFSYDHVFGESSTNEEVYRSCCQPLLQSVREGGGAVVFAFGQTGSGKTYTMLGNGATPGLYSLAVTELLSMTTGSMSASFYEVYGAKLYDLLNDRAEVKMLQDEYQNIHIVGLTEQPVRSVDDVNTLMMSGQQLRAIGTTHANDRSSRSHAVLEIKLTLADSGDGQQQQQQQQQGRMTFVDLAGSERASDTAETDARTRREGAEINKSLLALKECIRAMSMRKRHIPFRGSKLTQILRESFMGRCRTCVIATISPCQSHCEDTLNTLRYADRIKELKGPTNPNNGVRPIPCKTCGQPIFIGDRHVCKRQLASCPHCRQGFDKQELDAHIAECKEAPMRCPHCNERMLRGELNSHSRRCARFADTLRRLWASRAPPADGAPPAAGVCGGEGEVPVLRWAVLATDVSRTRADVRRDESHLPLLPSVLPQAPPRRTRRELSAQPQSAADGGGGAGLCRRQRDEQRGRTRRRQQRLHGRRGGGRGQRRLVTLHHQRRVRCDQRRPTRPQCARRLSSGASSARSSHQQLDGGLAVAGGDTDISTTQKYTRAHSAENSVGQLTSTASFIDRPSSQRAPGAGRRWNAAAAEDDRLSEQDALNENGGHGGGVVCPYARYGCPVKVTRLNVSAHLAEWMQRHLELVTSYADRVDEQNMQLRRLVVSETDTLSSWASKPHRSPPS